MKSNIEVHPVCSPALYEKAEIKVPEDKATKHLIVGVTSDRGLCGAIHSGVAKTIKSEIANLTGAGKEVMVINVGDKLRGLLHRYEWQCSPAKLIFMALMEDMNQLQSKLNSCLVVFLSLVAVAMW